MMKDWALAGENWLLLTPTGRTISLARAAIDMRSFGSVAVVLLSYSGVTPSEASQNVIAYDEWGDLLWQIEPLVMTQGRTPFTAIGVVDGSVFLFNAIGFSVYLNPSNGKIVRTEGIP